MPVPNSGISRETVEAARHIVANNRPCSSNGDRFWELSGGVLRCSECGRRMRTSVTRKKDGKRYFYYSCASRREGNLSSCENRKTHRAGRIEPMVWDLVSGLLTNPERLRAGLDELMERERNGSRGDPDLEARVWLERLAEAESMRAGYQELAAKGLMTIEELGARLEELEATRAGRATTSWTTFVGGPSTSKGWSRTGMRSWSSTPTPCRRNWRRMRPEERNRIYGMLRLQISAHPDGTLEASGILS